MAANERKSVSAPCHLELDRTADGQALNDIKLLKTQVESFQTLFNRVNTKQPVTPEEIRACTQQAATDIYQENLAAAKTKPAAGSSSKTPIAASAAAQASEPATTTKIQTSSATTLKSAIKQNAPAQKEVGDDGSVEVCAAAQSIRDD